MKQGLLICVYKFKVAMHPQINEKILLFCIYIVSKKGLHLNSYYNFNSFLILLNDKLQIKLITKKYKLLVKTEIPT